MSVFRTGEQVRQLRRDFGQHVIGLSRYRCYDYSQSQFAADIGVSRRTVIRWESVGVSHRYSLSINAIRTAEEKLSLARDPEKVTVDDREVSRAPACDCGRSRNLSGYDHHPGCAVFDS